MSDILRKIEAYKRTEISEAKVRVPFVTLERKAHDRDPPRGFLRAIEAQFGSGLPALIAEVKKASPSKGLIREKFDPPALARAYEAGGATCLSVLTDAPSFQGKLDDLTAARAATHLPALRKDFLFDPYQVYEARAAGADCILIIMACVNDREAKALNAAAHDLHMDVLAEAHDETEFNRALALETRLVGINNRNLRDFTVSLETTERLAARAPKDRLIVAESGISSHDDIARLRKAGVHVFLVGESLMRQADVKEATRRLLTGVLAAQPA
ncbi:indole-3-glycerol phosphate synthase TrpC [Rhodoblastus sp.]|uniref:indole-3-glycerol phosphate synthase TrpC n=1 Tax=Rhodoblastus sp. TaxID=1962975 RepID=UPI003F972C99